MLIYGSGGNAKVLIDGLLEKGEIIEAIFDDFTSKSSLLGIKIEKQYTSSLRPESSLIVAIGDNQTRAGVVKKIKHPIGTFIHKKASVSRLSKIAEGTVVFTGAIIQAGTTIGKHCIINTSSIIDHDCTLGDFVHVSPSATLCGHVEIGEGTMIGAGAKIIQQVKIGKNCIIGAGAVITHHIGDNKLVFPPHSEQKDRIVR